MGKYGTYLWLGESPVQFNWSYVKIKGFGGDMNEIHERERTGAWTDFILLLMGNNPFRERFLNLHFFLHSKKLTLTSWNEKSSWCALVLWTNKFSFTIGGERPSFVFHISHISCICHCGCWEWGDGFRNGISHTPSLKYWITFPSLPCTLRTIPTDGNANVRKGTKTRVTKSEYFTSWYLVRLCKIT